MLTAAWLAQLVERQIAGGSSGGGREEEEGEVYWAWMGREGGERIAFGGGRSRTRKITEENVLPM